MKYWLLSVALLLTVKSQCSRVYQRRAFHELTNDDRARVANTLLSVAQTNAWHDLVRSHNQLNEQIHSTPMFFAWHRMAVVYIERLARQFDPNFAMPYWESSHPQYLAEPQTYPIFLPEYFGGNGGPGGCVQDGRFANHRVRHPEPGCLLRRYDHSALRSFYNSDQIQVFYDSPSFSNFSESAQLNFHGIPHIAVGGFMAGMYSPNDPVFFLHHCYADYVYYHWQRQNPDRANDYYGTNRNNTPASPNDILPFFNIPVRDVLNIQDLCYNFVPSSTSPVGVTSSNDSSSQSSTSENSTNQGSTESPNSTNHGSTESSNSTNHGSTESSNSTNQGSTGSSNSTNQGSTRPAPNTNTNTNNFFNNETTDFDNFWSRFRQSLSIDLSSHLARVDIQPHSKPYFLPRWWLSMNNINQRVYFKFETLMADIKNRIDNEHQATRQKVNDKVADISSKFSRLKLLNRAN